MKKSLSITIRGHVQGVGFRYHARAKAMELLLTGFVRNQPDGTVFIEVVGEDLVVDEFVAWCRQGPRWARVDSVDIQSVETRNYAEFTVK
jgi:acylphosphatase